MKISAAPNTPVTKDFFNVQLGRLPSLDIRDMKGIPKETPQNFKWLNVTLEGKSKEVVPLKPFVFHSILLANETRYRYIAQMPKHEKAETYEEFWRDINVYGSSFKVGYYCKLRTYKIKDRTWLIGNKCNSEESNYQKQQSRNSKGFWR